MNTVQATRIRKGEPAKVEIPYTWTRSDAGIPLLVIQSGKWAKCYRVEEYRPDAEFVGRAFKLTPVGSGEPYYVFLAENGQDHRCDCRGNEARSYCKHVSVLYHSWGTGELPGDEPPIERFPSAEQVENDVEPPY